MNGRYLLDTNIIIALWKPDPTVVVRMNQADIALAAIVTGELFLGAYKSQRVEENIKRIEEFAAANNILPCDYITAQHYGRIKHGLLIKGRPIPEYDIWIAALALQHGLVVVSRDHHFTEIDGLNVEVW